MANIYHRIGLCNRMRIVYGRLNIHLYIFIWFRNSRISITPNHQVFFLGRYPIIFFVIFFLHGYFWTWWDLGGYFTIFVTLDFFRHTRTHCHDHIFIWVLIPATIFYTNLAYIHVLHPPSSYLLYHWSLWVTMVEVILNYCGFAYKSRWTTLREGPIWKWMVIKKYEAIYHSGHHPGLDIGTQFLFLYRTVIQEHYFNAIVYI